ncbi:MAG: transposase [Endomicrobium sp.]|jgi:transposase|nr:transposase [Endomicrobium sp.]
MLEKEKNCKEHFNDKAVRLIKVLQEQMDAIEQEIKERIDKDKELKKKAQIISSVKPVGQKTTMTLLACMPELGIANRREIAALAGLAPYADADDRGTAYKRRKTFVGRPIVKRLLFMCAMVAIKNNCNLKAFYETLYKQRQT